MASASRRLYPGATNQSGQASNFWRKIIARVEAAGGKRITAYAMRHTFPSNLLMAGVSDVKVARWLGHSDTRMVHRHYGHLLAFDDDINRLK